VGVGILVALLVWLQPVAQAAAGDANSGAADAYVAGVSGTIDYKVLQPVLAQRCYMCHGEAVQMKNVRLDSPQGVATNAQVMYLNVVKMRIMPLNNATGITEAERGLIQRWFESGAKI
jgi:uncharacterized membrane protein